MSPPDNQSLFALAPHPQQLIQVEASTLQTLAHHKLSFAPDSLDLSATGYAALADLSGKIELLSTIRHGAAA